jgi:hypothetical protein
MSSPLVILLAVLIGSAVGYALRIKQVGFKAEELASSISFVMFALAIFLFFTRNDKLFLLPWVADMIATFAYFCLKKRAFDLKGALLVIAGGLGGSALAFWLRHDPLWKMLNFIAFPFAIVYGVLWLRSLGKAAPEGGATGPVASVGHRLDEQPVHRSGRGPQRGGGRK